MNRFNVKKLSLWLTGVLAVLVLAACGQTKPPDLDPGGTSTLTVTVNGNGTVTSEAGGGLDCSSAGGDTCTISVDDGTSVTLTAAADEGETFTGWAGACSGSEATCTVTVNADTAVTANFSGEPTGGGDGTTFAIAAANDDAEELNNPSISDATRFPANFSYSDSSDLDLVFDPAHGTTQDVGLRFTNVTIPAGATIESAFIVFTADPEEPGNDSPVTVTIAGEASADPAAFANDPDGGPTGDISSRSTTDATVDWQINEAWTAGAEAQSADISAIVQEIVDMEGWTEGNAMAFIFTGADSTNYRSAQAFGEGRTAPVLHVTITEPTPEEPAPEEPAPEV